MDWVTNLSSSGPELSDDCKAACSKTVFTRTRPDSCASDSGPGALFGPGVPGPIPRVTCTAASSHLVPDSLNHWHASVNSQPFRGGKKAWAMTRPVLMTPALSALQICRRHIDARKELRARAGEDERQDAYAQ